MRCWAKFHQGLYCLLTWQNRAQRERTSRDIDDDLTGDTVETLDGDMALLTHPVEIGRLRELRYHSPTTFICEAIAQSAHVVAYGCPF